MQVDTGVRCIHCAEASIVAEIERVRPPRGGGIPPIGNRDASDNSYLSVKSFHCLNPNCQMMYYRPPGKPDAINEVLEKVRHSSLL